MTCLRNIAARGAHNCIGDINCDAALTPADVAVFVTFWFQCLQQGLAAADVDQNGVIEPADVTVFVNQWFSENVGGWC